MGIADKSIYLSTGASQHLRHIVLILPTVPPNLKFAILGFTIPIFTLYGMPLTRLLMVLLTEPVVLVLVGCVSTSPGIPSLYLFLLKVNEITLRVGYFGISSQLVD